MTISASAWIKRYKVARPASRPSVTVHVAALPGRSGRGVPVMPTSPDCPCKAIHNHTLPACSLCRCTHPDMRRSQGAANNHRMAWRMPSHCLPRRKASFRPAAACPCKAFRNHSEPCDTPQARISPEDRDSSPAQHIPSTEVRTFWLDPRYRRPGPRDASMALWPHRTMETTKMHHIQQRGTRQSRTNTTPFACGNKTSKRCDRQDGLQLEVPTT